MSKEKLEDLVELTSPREIRKFTEGRMVYIDHPTKGIRKVVGDKIYVDTVKLTERDPLYKSTCQ